MLAPRMLAALAAVTALALLGAIAVVSLRQDATQTALADTPALPGLAERITRITGLELSWEGEDGIGQVSIRREGDIWTIAEQAGYPADTGRVRAFLLSLADLRLVEAKTSDPARYGRLGVADPGSGGEIPGATRVRLHDAGGDAGDEVAADVLIGATRTGAAGAAMVYLRHMGEAQSWLALGAVDAAQRVTSWMDDTVIDIGANRIERIHLTGADGAVLDVRRTGGGEQPFELLDMPEDRKFTTFYTMNEITDGLSGLAFEAVRAVDGLIFEPSLGNAIYQTRGGLTVIVSFAEVRTEDGRAETWTHFAVNVASDASEEAIAFADLHAERLSAWAYRLSGNRLQRLRHTLETATRPAANTQ